MTVVRQGIKRSICYLPIAVRGIFYFKKAISVTAFAADTLLLLIYMMTAYSGFIEYYH